VLETFGTAPGISNGVDPGATTTFPQALTTGTCRQWLILIRAQGVMEVFYFATTYPSIVSTQLHQIWTLPKLTLAFSTSNLSTLQGVLTDSYDGPNSSMNQESPKGPQNFDIEQVLLAPLGESSPRPHLLVSELIDFHAEVTILDALGFSAIGATGYIRSPSRWPARPITAECEKVLPASVLC
jgi:hypothetical protein